jgi:hypothetical protein
LPLSGHQPELVVAPVALCELNLHGEFCWHGVAIVVGDCAGAVVGDCMGAVVDGATHAQSPFNWPPLPPLLASEHC